MDNDRVRAVALPPPQVDDGDDEAGDTPTLHQLTCQLVERVEVWNGFDSRRHHQTTDNVDAREKNTTRRHREH